MDKLEQIRRGPAAVLPKDAGFIITTSGINKNSVVLDAGTGSGFLAIYLSNVAKKVITYERRKEFYDIAKENFKFLKIKNITLKYKDIYKGIDESNLDLITLDLAEPWKVLPYAKKKLKKEAFIVSYLPTITQVMDYVKALEKHKFTDIKTVELLEREWIVADVVRPKSQMIAHTVFLIFARNQD